MCLSQSVLIMVLWPTPEGPATTVVRPVRRSASASRPSPPPSPAAIEQVVAE